MSRQIAIIGFALGFCSQHLIRLMDKNEHPARLFPVAGIAVRMPSQGQGAVGTTHIPVTRVRRDVENCVVRNALHFHFLFLVIVFEFEIDDFRA